MRIRSHEQEKQRRDVIDLVLALRRLRDSSMRNAKEFKSEYGRALAQGMGVAFHLSAQLAWGRFRDGLR